MADDFEKSNNQIFNKKTDDVSFGESCRVEYKVSNNQNRPINVYKKVPQHLQDKLNQAKEKIERDIILSDNTNDKNVRFMAISRFKKTKE